MFQDTYQILKESRATCVLLATAAVKVKDSEGIFQLRRALLDRGL
jgi:hypothetical protein